LPHESNGNRGIAIARRKSFVHALGDAAHFDSTGKTSKGATDQKCEGDLALYSDPSEVCSSWVGTGCTKTEAGFGAEEKDPNKECGDEGEKNAEMETGRREESWERSDGGKGIGLRILSSYFHERAMYTVADEIDGDEIEHDGANDFIDAVLLSEIGGASCPEESRTQRDHHYNGDCERRGEYCEILTNPGGGEGTEKQLPFCPDVPEPGTEGNHDSETSEQ